jgi:hypothetical protein
MIMTFQNGNSNKNHRGAPPQLPSVAGADALSDRNWFADHPRRQFRARVADSGLWIIRRRRVALLRAVAPRPFALPGDADTELAVAWYAAAFPDWSREKAQKWARRALRKGAANPQGVR